MQFAKISSIFTPKLLNLLFLWDISGELHKEGQIPSPSIILKKISHQSQWFNKYELQFYLLSSPSFFQMLKWNWKSLAVRGWSLLQYLSLIKVDHKVFCESPQQFKWKCFNNIWKCSNAQTPFYHGKTDVIPLGLMNLILTIRSAPI